MRPCVLEVYRAPQETILSIDPTQDYLASPGIIQSFDPAAVTCVAQIVIMGIEGGKQVSLPLLVDVPVVSPRGGGVTLTFPVKTGDECQLIFNDRCIDFWWQSGGVHRSVTYQEAARQ